MNIYVGNLAVEVTEDEIREAFIVFGEVTSVTMMDNKYLGSGQPIRYSFVQMTSKLEGQAAVAALQEKYLGGQVIKVVEALPLSDHGDHNSHPGKKGRYINGKTRQR